MISSFQLQQQTQIKNMTKELEYDDKGKLTAILFSDGRKYTFEYDELGRFISETDVYGDKYTFEYGKQNKLISLTYPDGSKTIF